MYVLKVDYRGGGIPRYYVTEENEKPMIILPEIKKCVVFIGAKVGDKIKYGGTGFVVGTPVKGQNNKYFPHLVTAKHNIDAIRKISSDNKVWFRINLTNGKSTDIPSPLDAWYFHPTEKNIDAAVLTLFDLSGSTFDYLNVPESWAVTDTKRRDLKIEEGEDIFITGLFRFHYGDNKNYPIVRVGTIALFPEEKVYVGNEFGKVDAYLIETRSIKGLSGSPVFVNLGQNESINNEIRPRAVGVQINHWLGLVHGHWSDVADEFDFVSEDNDKGDFVEKMNVGISVVVPAIKILEIVNRVEIKKMREDIELKELKENSTTLD